MTNILNKVHIQLIKLFIFNNSLPLRSNYYGKGSGITLDFSNTSEAFLSVTYSNFNGNFGNHISCNSAGSILIAMINYSSFTDSKSVDDASFIAPININTNANLSIILLYKVQVNNNRISNDHHGAFYIVSTFGDVNINFYFVNFSYNHYLGNDGGALSISLSSTRINYNYTITVKECRFVNNRSPGHGTAIHLDAEGGIIQILKTVFDRNVAGSSIVYIIHHDFPHSADVNLLIDTSKFTNNVASSLHLSACELTLSGMLLFVNNIGENGGALYLNEGTTIKVEDGASIQFIGNNATINGGAIYVDLTFSCVNTFGLIFNYNGSVIFINNSAIIAGNSLYFNIPRSCSPCTDVSNVNSIMHIPCKFRYSQPVNGTMTHIPCDLDYKLLNGTGAPIVTSPHELRLYFPFNDGYNISSTSDHNVYFVRNNILGRPVKFTGAVFDYFGKPTEPIQFQVQLQCSSYSLVGDNNILFRLVDNITFLGINIRGKKIDSDSINVNLTLTSLFYSLKKINTTLVVELVPCNDHSGYTYSEESQTCVCYHHNVKCNDDGNEIKRGYWFGSINSKATTSLCPNHYCEFTDRKQTSGGYIELPNTINAQCNDHRVGRACGECSSGYTLSYDSTDCISVDQCGAGWTVLVITLTCLYWIAVVAGVFSLMYLKFQISSGYLYGLIYYYSMVGILLNNNPYVSDDAFQFVSILSSFAQLTPQFLRKLCFVKGMSGIDQLFIHYSHAVGVSLLLLLIVVAARHSSRITLFVHRCIIRVICLLILLSYTSIASTSVQLLLPLKFTDIKDWYTYSSPHIQYFHGRHVIYGTVAFICELFVVGLSLLLLLEPVLSRKINFIRIKPLLDQFQGCYKDNYRCFAAYYLICRQVIFLILYIFNSNYSNMLFYLQTACVVIVVIHIWFQPYQNELLNALDGVMLLVMVLVVNINTFTFLQDATTEISVILVILPFLLFCIIAVKKVIEKCCTHRHEYDNIDDEDHEGCTPKGNDEEHEESISNINDEECIPMR